jgi:hypothetical protein
MNFGLINLEFNLEFSFMLYMLVCVCMCASKGRQLIECHCSSSYILKPSGSSVFRTFIQF